MLWIETYRPAVLGEILGQDSVVASLSSFAASGNVPHLLISGPHGTGKTAAIEAFAKVLYHDHWEENTSIFQTGDLFEQGKAYLEADERYAHIYQKDLSLIANFKYIVRWYASIRPLDAPFKLMVFEDAGALTREAQQALRRIMEQFSGTCRFILCAQNQSAIIPAIASRCLPLFFGPIANQVIEDRLREVLAGVAGDRPPVTDEDLDLIIQAARGDLRRAIMMLQVAVTTDQSVSEIAAARSETSTVALAVFNALQAQETAQAIRMVESLLIDYGLSGKEVISALSEVVHREYNAPAIVRALADTDHRLGHCNNEFVQLNALLMRIAQEGFA
ncbi:AAA family ATPase [Methanosphaerula palustris]|uniref:Replication factor C small subunit n=1 Tax=Methanosphaerula palustris (strain ATCC BAA-1556 / DSM 19958 / E1-9c) TaxID=521011 RepID=B8GKP0_METPE|nr:AAA family ATPase [Methanosphaerula palustris]ACL17186.1 Replication factor C [Methanosphaerula palustris E1-9c]